MKKVAFFDTKPYDKESFDPVFAGKYEVEYIEHKLSSKTAVLADGCDAVCAFVNDNIDEKAIKKLSDMGIKIIAMRCAGYNNVDFKAAYKNKVAVVRVPGYSPYAVAEHAMALLLTLNRKIHKAYNRTREFNYSLAGLTGVDLHGKVMGVVGTGRIGRVFIDICKGFGMDVIAYDPFPAKDADINYTDIDTLFAKSDFVSLHCPLTNDTYHLVNADRLALMKPTATLINTSRGALVDSRALLDALRSKKLKGAALDVYEEEAEFFFEDWSNQVVDDSILQLLTSMPNVIITSHQAFLTEEALANIASVTAKNLDEYFSGDYMENEVCYHCDKKGKSDCAKDKKQRCF